MSDSDTTNLTMELEKHGIIQPFSTVKKIVEAVIRNDSRNPAQEYFSGLKWDGVPRLDRWLSYYCGAQKDHPEYLAAVGRKWLVAAVNRVFEPGCKFENMLILEGEQGVKKSMALRELATIHGKAYFDDSIELSDLGSDKTVPKLQGVLIVEIAELTGIHKKDVKGLKQQLSIQSDRYVLKYANETSIFPRKFIFAASVNPEGDGYLQDATGNRRFWPVKCGPNIDIEALKRDKEQLWAEAVVLYRAGERLYLEDRIEKLAKEAQGDRSHVHAWYADLEKFKDAKSPVFDSEIWAALGINDRTKRTRAGSLDIAKIMTSLNFERGKRRNNGKTEACWELKNQDIEIEL